MWILVLDSLDTIIDFLSQDTCFPAPQHVVMPSIDLNNL